MSSTGPDTPRSTDATRRKNERATASLPLHDTQDFDDTERGFVGHSEQRQVLAADGRLVWDLDAYRFLDEPVPDTANPSLWRQGQLLSRDGLFEVVPGIYQVRGYDLSVMSLVEGERGVIVIDPLTTKETAAAAIALYREHRGDHPVTAVVYTHSHLDHFGGVRGVVSEDDVVSRGVPVIAPQGFLEHAVSENVFAGPAMSRRAGYMYGAALDKGPAGQIGAGLGQTTSLGEPTLIAPTVDVTTTGQELTVDGVRIVFQVTPGTEAPAEMNFFFPEHRALCTAENTSHTLHNILTLRGAEVRDARAWSDYLNETIDLWADELEVVFASHHWPTWGRERAVSFMAMQSDMYSYLHDQTLRLLNKGYVGAEIAEMLEMPPALASQWHTHGYYGSVSHNVKAIYQRYMGWYDANPAHLWGHPPEAVARRYVAAMGGAVGAVSVARSAFEEGDYRWAAEVLNHVLFADQDHAEARSLQADTFEQLAFGCENGTWRSAFLTGAAELRRGIIGVPLSSGSSDLSAALTVEQLLSALAICVDGPRAWGEHLMISFVVDDLEETHVVELRHGTLVRRRADAPAPGSTTFTLTRPALGGLLAGALDLGEALADGRVSVEGDPAVLARLVDLLDPPGGNFPIVTP
jgi:alkyl sulfatase BDS1-like metallo-beta-lactamase superfamily hydrolase